MTRTFASGFSSGPLEITRDEPGRRLCIEWPRGTKPPMLQGCLIILSFVVLCVLYLPMFRWFLAPIAELVFSEPRTRALFGMTCHALVLALACGQYLRLRRAPGIEVLTRIDADGSRGEISLAGTASHFWSREQRIPLTELEVLRMSGDWEGALRLTLRRRGPHGKAREATFAFNVTEVGGREGAVALALRLGSAAGRPAYRVVWSDPREIELELGPRAPGREPVPDPGSLDDARQPGEVARAIAAVEVLPPLEPSTFQRAGCLTVWEPGRLVSFRKPMNRSVLIPIYVPLLFPLAFLVLLALGTRISEDPIVVLRVLGASFAGSLLVALVGVVFAALFLPAEFPRRTTIDWQAGRVLVTGLRQRLEIPLSAVTAVALRLSGNDTYSGHVSLAYAGPSGSPASRLLALTPSHRELSAAWRQAIPLATELARALRVGRRLYDFAPGEDSPAPLLADLPGRGR